jgi:hypothetical protein
MPVLAEVGNIRCGACRAQVEAIHQEQPIPQVLVSQRQRSVKMPVVAEVGATSAVEPVGEPQVEGFTKSN